MSNVILTSQSSSSPCIENQSFGMVKGSCNKMFVNSGCRGNFKSTASGKTLSCSSSNYAYQECPLPSVPTDCSIYDNITLVNQDSSSACTPYNSFNMVNGSCTTMYVNQGCRGDFKSTVSGQTFNCASDNYAYKECTLPGVYSNCTNVEPPLLPQLLYSNFSYVYFKNM